MKPLRNTMSGRSNLSVSFLYCHSHTAQVGLLLIGRTKRTWENYITSAWFCFDGENVPIKSSKHSLLKKGQILRTQFSRCFMSTFFYIWTNLSHDPPLSVPPFVPDSEEFLCKCLIFSLKRGTADPQTYPNRWEEFCYGNTTATQSSFGILCWEAKAS